MNKLHHYKDGPIKTIVKEHLRDAMNTLESDITDYAIHNGGASFIQVSKVLHLIDKVMIDRGISPQTQSPTLPHITVKTIN